jgi:hypothetical protein
LFPRDVDDVLVHVGEQTVGIQIPLDEVGALRLGLVHRGGQEYTDRITYMIASGEPMVDFAGRRAFGGAEVASMASGPYVLAGLPEGTYSVQMMFPSCESEHSSATIEIDRGEIAEATFVVK